MHTSMHSHIKRRKVNAISTEQKDEGLVPDVAKPFVIPVVGLVVGACSQPKKACPNMPVAKRSGHTCFYTQPRKPPLKRDR